MFQRPFTPFILIALMALLPAFKAGAAEFVLLENFPRADASAFNVVGTGLPDGRLLVWNGNTLYTQTGVDADAFDAIASGYAGDPSFITMAPDGRHALLGAGFSGNLYLVDTENPADFSEEAIVANVPHYAAVYLSDTLVLIDAGVFGEPSELRMLDLAAGKASPVPVVAKSARYKNQVVQKPEGSYSASLALDARYDIVYAMDANTNELRYFSTSELTAAFTNQETLDWASDGDIVGATGDYLGGGIAGVTSQGLLVNGGFGAVNLIDFQTLPLKAGEGEIVDALQPAGEFVFYSVIFNEPGDTINIYVGDFTPESTINGYVYRVDLSTAGEGEGEGEDNLDAAAEALLEDFAAADTSADGQLTFVEAQASLGTLTQAQFAALDENSDGFLGESELEAQIPDPTPGCAFLEDGLPGLEGILSDLFVFGMALMTLLAIGAFKKSSI